MDHGVDAVPVSTETRALADVVGRLVEGEPQQACSDDAADELRNPVTNGIGQGDPLGDQGANGHGGVDVAARNRTDGVDETHEDEAERQRGGHDPS